MDFSDPDLVARAYVMQWMHENGLHNALKALEKDLGRLYDDSQLPEASQLMQLVWRHVEERLQQQQELEDEDEDPDAGAGGGAEGAGGGAGGAGGGGGGSSRSRRRQQQEEALQLLRAGCDDYAGRAVVAEVPVEVHRANVIAVRMVPEQDCVITAAGDGCVRCVRYGSLGGGGSGGGAAAAAAAVEVVWQTRVGSSALLSLALHPDYCRGLPLVAVGAMDGRLTVLHGPTGATLATLQPHNKYVVRVAWAPTTATPAAAAAAATGMRNPTKPNTTDSDASPGPSLSPTAAAAAGSAATAQEAGLKTTAVACGDSGSGPRAVSPGPQGIRWPALLLATASTDETVTIVRLDLDLDLGTGLNGLSAAAAAGAGRLKTVRQVPYGAAVTDVAFLPERRPGARATTPAGDPAPTSTPTPTPATATAAAAAAAGDPAAPVSLTLVVAVRGSNYLRLLDVGRLVWQEEASASASSGSGSGSGSGAAVPTSSSSSPTAAVAVAAAAAGGGGGPVPESLVNLNESGDDHVSFTAKHLVASPCGRYLLVCTDTPRQLVLRTSDWSLLRVLFGLPVDQFPQPVAAWHRDSNYIYASGANAQLCVFHLGSGRLVLSTTHHKVNLRDLDYDPDRNLLATCSFDKTVKLLAPAVPAVPAGAAVAEGAVGAAVAVAVAEGAEAVGAAAAVGAAGSPAAP
ncbi:hypothetical protein PLESTB_001191500 [Pleodorina starrii]|uniref:LisH domain-containing protein n=1 Tax=Pleodorina starrii TaxID=330485 RepID=A0A9W6BRQ8_9CHLO|nr:hypothetical protein PLESTB_001191500 [Pleodorina starrii]GLC71480.1 hypothetical protein PLESTF_001120500 [Pleodorina starrii]